MNEDTRFALIISAVVVCVVGFTIGAIIFIKVFLLKRKLKIENKKALENIEENDKVVNSEKFMEVDYELKKKFKGSLISDETIELCSNTIIRNNYQNILILGNNNFFEILSITNKTNKNFYIIEEESDLNIHKKIVKEKNYEDNLSVIKMKESIEKKFDSILILQPNLDLVDCFEKYFKNLNNKGMMIMANLDKNKKHKKILYKKLIKERIKFDYVNWDKGFFLIVNT